MKATTKRRTIKTWIEEGYTLYTSTQGDAILYNKEELKGIIYLYNYASYRFNVKNFMNPDPVVIQQLLDKGTDFVELHDNGCMMYRI